MCDGKEPVKIQGGRYVAVNIMEFWTMKVYAVGFLIGVAVVADIIILGGDEGSGSVLSGGYFEGSIDGNLEGVGPV